MRRRAVLLSNLIWLTFVAGLAVLFWPSSLGGHVSYVMVSGESMEPGLHSGDLVLVRTLDSYERGDTVAFRVPDGQPGEGATVIHRIVGNDATGYVTQGDNRDDRDLWRPTDGDVVGKQWIRVPGAGRLMAALRAPLPLASLAAGMTLITLLGTRKPKPQPATERG